MYLGVNRHEVHNVLLNDSENLKRFYVQCCRGEKKNCDKAKKKRSKMYSFLKLGKRYSGVCYCYNLINLKFYQNKMWQKVEFGEQGHGKLLQQCSPRCGRRSHTKICWFCFYSMQLPLFWYVLCSWLNNSGTYSQCIGGRFWQLQRKTAFVKMKAFILK